MIESGAGGGITAEQAVQDEFHVVLTHLRVAEQLALNLHFDALYDRTQGILHELDRLMLYVAKGSVGELRHHVGRDVEDTAYVLYGEYLGLDQLRCHWIHGELLVLDAVFQVKSPRRRHPDIKDYKEAVASRDRKLLTLVNVGYDTMHIAMSYDGNQSKAVCDEGFRLADEIIKICSKMLPKQQNP